MEALKHIEKYRPVGKEYEINWERIFNGRDERRKDCSKATKRRTN